MATVDTTFGVLAVGAKFLLRNWQTRSTDRSPIYTKIAPRSPFPRQGAQNAEYYMPRRGLPDRYCLTAFEDAQEVVAI